MFGCGGPRWEKVVGGRSDMGGASGQAISERLSCWRSQDKWHGVWSVSAVAECAMSQRIAVEGSWYS